MLTVVCTDAAISTGRDPRVLGGLEVISNIHIQAVSANSKCVSKFVSYPNSCPYHVFEARLKDLEIPGWLMLNQIIIIQCSRFFQDPINDLTVVADYERHSGRRLWFGNGVFNVKSIPICDGGAPIDATKVALDHSEVAIYHDDSSGAPQGNTK